MTSIILMTNFLRAVTENMRQFSGILRTPFHSFLSSLTRKTIARTPEAIRALPNEPTYKQPIASHPEFFAQYAVGIIVYNKYRPQESYIISNLFIESDDTEGPYVVALLTTDKMGSPWLRYGTMRMVKLASANEQFFLPLSGDNYIIKG